MLFRNSKDTHAWDYKDRIVHILATIYYIIISIVKGSKYSKQVNVISIHCFRFVTDSLDLYYT